MAKKHHDPDFVYLTDENGREVAFAYLDTVHYNGSRFVVLLPADEIYPQALILEVTHVDPRTGEETYVFPDSDEVIDAVYQTFLDEHPGEFED